MSRSPHITTPIRRFGRWELDLTPPPPVRGHLHLPPRPKATSDHYDYRHALHSDSSFGCSSCPESRTRRPPPKHRLAPPKRRPPGPPPRVCGALRPLLAGEHPRAVRSCFAVR